MGWSCRQEQNQRPRSLAVGPAESSDFTPLLPPTPKRQAQASRAERAAWLSRPWPRKHREAWLPSLDGTRQGSSSPWCEGGACWGWAERCSPAASECGRRPATPLHTPPWATGQARTTLSTITLQNRAKSSPPETPFAPAVSSGAPETGHPIPSMCGHKGP